MTDEQMGKLKEFIEEQHKKTRTLMVEVYERLKKLIELKAWDLERKIENLDSSVSTLESEVSSLADEIQ